MPSINFSGKNLGYLITKLGVTQASIESVIGKRQQTISNFIKEKNQMEAEDLIRLSDHFGLSLEDFTLRDLSKGNLITEAYIKRFHEKGNLKGNLTGHLKGQIHKNIGEEKARESAQKPGDDNGYTMVMILLKEMNAKLDRISASVENPKKIKGLKAP